MKAGSWTYSKIKLFETCPRKYEAEHITKEVKFTDNEHTLYGKEFHKAAEKYFISNEPLPTHLEYAEPMLAKLKAMQGAKFIEQKMGILKRDGKLMPCEYWHKDVWWRGSADLAIYNFDKEEAKAIDLKTSKDTKHADIRQLKLYAAWIFLTYSQIKTVKMGLLFVVCGEFIREEIGTVNRLDIFAELDDLLQQRDTAYETGIFNPKPSGLCKRHCDVLSCGHNGRNN